MKEKKKSSCVFRFAKELSNDDAGVASGAVFQEVRPGAGFKTGNFAKGKLGSTAIVACMKIKALPEVQSNVLGVQ